MIHTTTPLKLSYYDRPSSLCKVYFSQWGNYLPKRELGHFYSPSGFRGVWNFKVFKSFTQIWGDLRVSVPAYENTGLGIGHFLELRVQLSLKQLGL